MTIGELIRTYRKASGLTQSRLAKELGVSQYAVSAWEIGAHFPSLSSILLISEITNAPIQELKDSLIQARMNNMEHGKPQAAKVKKDSMQIDLRDYFAAKALQGQLAAQTEESGFWLEEQYPVVASICYSLADAMIKERSK